MIELWGQAVRSIEALVKPAHRDQWLRPIECVAIGEGRIRLRAPNRYHKEWFEDHFLPSILEDLEARTNSRFAVDFEITEEPMVEPVVAARVSTAAVEAPRPALPSPRGLDARYTF